MKRELEQLQNRLKVRECFNKRMKPLKKLVYDESAATCSWCLCLFVQEETLRVQAETKLDINLESSRISDMVRQIHRHVWCAPQIHFIQVFFSIKVIQWSLSANRKCWQIIQQTLIKTIWVNVNTFGLKRKKSSADFVFFCQFTEQEKKLMEASTDFHHKVIRL